MSLEIFLRDSRTRGSVTLLSAAIHYVLNIATKVSSMMEGSPLIDPMHFGWTTEEERSSIAGANVGEHGLAIVCRRGFWRAAADSAVHSSSGCQGDAH